MSKADCPISPVFDFTFEDLASPFTADLQAYLNTHSNARYHHIATGAAVFDTADLTTPRILLVQRSASDSMPNRWEIPGGSCDDTDESILHGVARELWEETGLKASHVSVPIGSPHLFLTRSGKTVCKFNFVVQARADDEGRFDVRLDPDEHQQFVWATEEEVRSKKVGDIELRFTMKDLEDTVLLAFEQFKEK